MASHFLNDDQQLMREAVRNFVDEEVRPRVGEIAETAEYPYDLYQRAAELGLTGLNIPEEYGGLGLGLTTEVMMLEEIGRACPTLALALQVNSYCMSEILAYGTEEQKLKWLPDLATGRRIGGISSTEAPGSTNRPEWPVGVVRDGDEYVVNVTKLLQTNVLRSGTIVLNLKGEEGNVKLIVDKENTPGIEAAGVYHKIGLTGSDTGELTMQDVRVPAENELAADGKFVLSGGPKILCAAISLGIAEEAFERVLEYLKQRTKDFKPLASFGTVGSELAKMATEIELLNSQVYTAAYLDELGGNTAKEGFMAKAYGSELAVRTVSRCIELFGGVGTMVEMGLGRMWGDAQALCIAECSSTMISSIIQSHLGIEVEYL